MILERLLFDSYSFYDKNIVFLCRYILVDSFVGCYHKKDETQIV